MFKVGLNVWDHLLPSSGTLNDFNNDYLTICTGNLHGHSANAECMLVTAAIIPQSVELIDVNT